MFPPKNIGAANIHTQKKMSHVKWINRVGFCRKQISVVVIVCVSEISAFSGQFAHSYTTKLT